MSTLTPHQRKALDYKKHISLTANAGSGKTFVLSKRYLEIALNENLPLRNIAAITFTDKAAGELYQKIAREIEDRLRTAKEKSEKEKLELIRRQLVSANISTIHSFCIDILREHPVEADIDANFTPIDEIYADELIELCVEEVIKSSLENPTEQADLKKLIRIFSSKHIFARELASALKHRRSILIIEKSIYDKHVEQIAKEFYEKFLSYCSSLVEENIPSFLDAVKKINQAVLKKNSNNAKAFQIKNVLSKLSKAKSIEEKLSLVSEIKTNMLTKAGTIAIREYLSNDVRENLEKECLAVEIFLDKISYFVIPENHSEIELELAYFGKIFINFFNKSLNLYSEKKKQEGYLDYEDILLFTQNILENEDVRKSLSEKFKYIMIDEYQDTNELQYNIFLPILDYLKCGNLFVVGDEKQSIYMFRDAELEVFNKTKSEIIHHAGKGSLLTLPDSFRMAPNICVFVNSLFRKLFENPNPLFNEVEHSDIVCARNDDILGRVEILLNETSDKENEEAAEADLVAKKILQLVNSNSQEEKAAWGQIAILCRKRKSFIELEKAFTREKIPYSIIGGKGFYQRQSIYDIYNYFSFLLDQNNDTALVGILRSPFFNISDTEIYEISLHNDTTLWNKLKSIAESKPELRRIVDLLEMNIELVTKTEISVLLRKILTETGYLSVISSKPNSAQEEANLNKLISLTINFFTEGFRTLYDYVDYLSEAINEIEDESQAAFSEEDNSVKIMTIHQAKGLEFPVVFLYRCGETTQRSFVKSKSVTVNKEFGLLTRVPLNENYFSEFETAPIVNVFNYIINRKDSAELKRLFYVAVTRAINQLYISASLNSDHSPKSFSFLKLLYEGLCIDFASANYKLVSPLKFLKKNNGDFINEEKKLEIDIPITKSLEKAESVIENFDYYPQVKSYLTKPIADSPFGEIISATKLSTYNQCPLKYKLIYHFGFLSLMNEKRDWLKDSRQVLFDFNSREEVSLSSYGEEEKSVSDSEYSQIKGTIIHRLLSEAVPLDIIPQKIDFYLNSIFSKAQISEFPVDNLKLEVSRELKNYFQSDIYFQLTKAENYRNEFEIYCQHKNYYLYGIVDKLIIEKNKLIIIDYKTDKVKPEELPAKAEQYLSQLKFYAFIASKLFKISEIDIKIIFILHPDKVSTMKLKPEDLIQIQKDIEEMMENVRKNSFSKNLSHCGFCNFAVESKCIVA